MDFRLTDEQRSLRNQVEEFAERELNGDLTARDADSEFSWEGWKKCAALGVQGLPIPDEYGGGGADPLTVAVALEALGHACRDNGLIFSINAHMWSCEIPILRFGTEEPKRRYLPGLVDGSLVGVQTMTEPGSGSDAFAMATAASMRNGSYVLNGSKTFITNAPIATVFVVFASTRRGGSFGACSAFVVDRDTPGLSLGRPFKKMGLRTSPMSEVFFDDCEIPAENLLGRVGAGMAIFNHSMDWERSLILASAVGTMQRELETGIEYARDRAQFGTPIGRFQSVANRLVDMRVRVEAARLLVYQQAWRKGQGRTSPLDAALVKLFVSEAYVQSSLDALQTFGGYGYMTAQEVERDVRDAIGSRLYSGTSDIQRNIIAAYMGL